MWTSIKVFQVSVVGTKFDIVDMESSWYQRKYMEALKGVSMMSVNPEQLDKTEIRGKAKSYSI